MNFRHGSLIVRHTNTHINALVVLIPLPWFHFTEKGPAKSSDVVLNGLDRLTRGLGRSPILCSNGRGHARWQRTHRWIIFFTVRVRAISQYLCRRRASVSVGPPWAHCSSTARTINSIRGPPRDRNIGCFASNVSEEFQPKNHSQHP